MAKAIYRRSDGPLVKAGTFVSSVLIPLFLISASLGADTRPLAIESPLPKYPDSLKKRGVGGSGEFIMDIDRGTGRVTAVRIKKSTGVLLLDQCAIEALKHWKFRPHDAAHCVTPITFTPGPPRY